MKQFDPMARIEKERMTQPENRIWLHAQTGEFYFKTHPIAGLSPLQRRILAFLLERPAVYLTKTEIIKASWPRDVERNGVSDDALFHQISVLRRLLRQYSPQRFIVTWRGIPEGGYRLVNNGRFPSSHLHQQGVTP